MLDMGASTKRQILFVDDDEQWRDQASASLAEAGFDVLPAADASEAMARAAESPLGMIIVDEDLAGESGAMLARFLRHNNPGVPTLLYTSPGQEAHATPFPRSEAADQFLPKGSMEELIVSVGCYFR